MIWAMVLAGLVSIVLLEIFWLLTPYRIYFLVLHYKALNAALYSAGSNWRLTSNDRLQYSDCDFEVEYWRSSRPDGAPQWRSGSKSYSFTKAPAKLNAMLERRYLKLSGESSPVAVVSGTSQFEPQEPTP